MPAGEQVFADRATLADIYEERNRVRDRIQARERWFPSVPLHGLAPFTWDIPVNAWTVSSGAMDMNDSLAHIFKTQAVPEAAVVGAAVDNLSTNFKFVGMAHEDKVLCRPKTEYCLQYVSSPAQSALKARLSEFSATATSASPTSLPSISQSSFSTGSVLPF